MRRLGNTLYILSDDLFLTVDDKNVVAKRSGEVVGRVPLHTLTNIYSFSYMGASPALMGKCAEEGVELAFFTPSGKFWQMLLECRRAMFYFGMRKAL